MPFPFCLPTEVTYGGHYLGKVICAILGASLFSGRFSNFVSNDNLLFLFLLLFHLSENLFFHSCLLALNFSLLAETKGR